MEAGAGGGQDSRIIAFEVILRHPVEMLLTIQVSFQIPALLGNQLKIGFSFLTAPYTYTLNLFEAEVHAIDVYTSYAD